MKQALKRLVPPPARKLYRSAEFGLRLMRELDFSSPGAMRESAGVALTILKVRADSLLDIPGLKSLHRLARELDQRKVAGDFVECGVFRGGSAALLGAALARSPLKRDLWLFDSFQGLPRPTVLDGPDAPAFEGDLIGDAGSVWRLMVSVGVPSARLHICPGWFQETFASAQIGQIALLHIDADWYESITLCLRHFWDLVASGGVVILDDYDAWPGCKTALEAFARERGLKVMLQRVGTAPPFFYKQA
jgi:O-methyltransferase